MKNLPEKIYCDIFHSWDKDALIIPDGIGYVRSDIAETDRNAFAIFCYDAGKWGGERDANKLYELFNSRNK